MKCLKTPFNDASTGLQLGEHCEPRSTDQLAPHTAFWTFSFVRFQFELAIRGAGAAQLGNESLSFPGSISLERSPPPPELVFNVSNHRGSFLAVKCEGVTASSAPEKPDTGLCGVTGLFSCQAARTWPWALDPHPTICHLDTSSCPLLSLSGTPMAPGVPSL